MDGDRARFALAGLRGMAVMAVMAFFSSLFMFGGTFATDYSHCTATDFLRKLDEFINLSFVENLEDHDGVCLFFKIITDNLDSTASDNIAANFGPPGLVGIY